MTCDNCGGGHETPCWKRNERTGQYDVEPDLAPCFQSLRDRVVALETGPGENATPLERVVWALDKIADKLEAVEMNTRQGFGR